MELFSVAFLVFLLISIFLYYTVFRQKQWICLLIVSIVFYVWTGYQNALFILFTSATTYVAGILMTRMSDQFEAVKETDILPEERKKLKEKNLKRKRLVLYGTLLLNLGVLGYVKYWDVLYNAISNAFFNSENQVMGILLPLGISFYTFQSIGYMIDVYGGKSRAEKNFFRYLLFISFFPQLIQGPINRFDQMSIQLYASHKVRYQNVKEFFCLFLFGALKKYAIANVLSEHISNILDAPNEKTSGALIIFAILLYSIQQYADFSGGIDMVMGVARLFDIQMMPNFMQPYFSTSLADFWRRWHISLGAWMRDYVFYPIALTKPMKKLGKRAGRRWGKHIGRTLPACIANIFVFFLVGLWHGAELHYILWGLYNGIVIATSDLLAPTFERITLFLHINVEAKLFRIFRMIRTFVVVNVGWYFDRICQVKDIILCFKNTFFNFDIGGLFSYIHGEVSAYAILIVTVACSLVFLNSAKKEKDSSFEISSTKAVVRVSFYYFAAMLILISLAFSENVSGGFMYANF